MTLGQADVIADMPSPAPPLGVGAGLASYAQQPRPIALIGMMGAGKTVVGRRLAARLNLPFIDSDDEIERCAQLSIAEIFARHGEAYFRDRENKVVTRLVASGSGVLATGGGSFIHPATRLVLKERCLSVWLRADFDVLLRRVRKRHNRPLLRTPDPEATLRRLMDARYPVYAEAHVTVESRDGPHEQVVDDVLAAIRAHAGALEAVGPPA